MHTPQLTYMVEKNHDHPRWWQLNEKQHINESWGKSRIYMPTGKWSLADDRHSSGVRYHALEVQRQGEGHSTERREWNLKALKGKVTANVAIFCPRIPQRRKGTYGKEGLTWNLYISSDAVWREERGGIKGKGKVVGLKPALCVHCWTLNTQHIWWVNEWWTQRSAFVYSLHLTLLDNFIGLLYFTGKGKEEGREPDSLASSPRSTHCCDLFLSLFFFY